MAVNLRPAVASVPPLIDAITADLRLSGPAAGLLTTLPVLCMGLFAPVAPVGARRLGAPMVLAAAVALIAVGSAIRGVGAVGLYAGSAVAGIGIAVAGTLLPGLVKARFPDQVGPVTGLYTAGLIGGALLAAGATEPLASAGGVGWPGALALWALPAVAALGVWLAVTRPVPATTPPDARVGLPWRDRTAWLATGFMGGQSLLFYATLAWLAACYTSLGVDATTAGLLLAVFSATQLVSALGLPLLAHRGGRLGPWIAVSVGLCVAGLVLVALVPLVSPWLWATILGLGMGGQFALALTLVAQIAPTPAAAPSYSGLAFLVGYLLAALGPVAAGGLRDLSGGYRAPFLVLAGVGLAVLALGVIAARRTTSPSS